jgi:hypothetical protein
MIFSAKLCSEGFSYWSCQFASPIFLTWVLAESAIVKMPAPSMMESLTTRRPGRARNGNPCSEFPVPETQASGVVTRKERVVQAMRNTRKLPTAATWGNSGWRAMRIPKPPITQPNA